MSSYNVNIDKAVQAAEELRASIKDPRILQLYDAIARIDYKRNVAEMDFKSKTKPEPPVLYPLSATPCFDRGKSKNYKQLQDKYYTFYTKENRDTLAKKHYPDFSKTVLRDIKENGTPVLATVMPFYFTYTYDGYKVDYTTLNKVKDELIAERGKLIKNKKKIAELVARHKELRRQITAVSPQIITTQLDKVYLKTFAKCVFTEGLSESQNLYLTAVGWMSLPPYFFEDSLYDLATNDYKNRDVNYYFHFLPEAAIALIVKDLQADAGSAFFKVGVTAADVLAKVKERAESETLFVSKFTVEVACRMLNERLKEFVPDAKAEKQNIIIDIPYMGLDKLSKADLKRVADQIFHHYSLFARYNEYVRHFNTLLVPAYNAACQRYADAPKVYNATMQALRQEAISILPAGERDLPYLDTYTSLIKSRRFATYYELCDHVTGIRRHDEQLAAKRQIMFNQIAIQEQNKAILANQERLYQQRMEHQRQLIHQAERSQRDVMEKLHSIENKVKDQQVIIYW
ncbi:MAG: hypothetical protein IJX70_01915 [Clostridia bacterium]|nr:hypothetical protein [Clostridia bacterium]